MPGWRLGNDGVSEATSGWTRLAGQNAAGVPARARGHLAGLRVHERRWLVFLCSLTKPQLGRPGGRGRLRIAERNRQVVYFQKRRGGAEACSQSHPEEESLSWATSLLLGSL